MGKFNKQTKEPIKYWFVNFTLTSGDVLKFYVKARTHAESLQKADDYMYWLDDKSLASMLRNKLQTFKLMP